MNCQKIQDIIITDYIDGQLDDRRKSFIQEHLRSCHQCREFLGVVQESVVAPLMNVEKSNAPAIIWENLQERIAAQEQPKENLIAQVWERVSSLINIPRPVFALTSFVTLIFMIGILPQFMMNAPVVKIDQQGQVEYLSVLTDAGADASAQDSADLGTPIEKYFL